MQLKPVLWYIIMYARCYIFRNTCLTFTNLNARFSHTCMHVICLVPSTLTSEMWHIQPWVQLLTSSIFLQSSVDPERSGASWAKPALLTHTSTPPNCALAVANIAFTSSSLATSHFTANSLPNLSAPLLVCSRDSSYKIWIISLISCGNAIWSWQFGGLNIDINGIGVSMLALFQCQYSDFWWSCNRLHKVE